MDKLFDRSMRVSQELQKEIAIILQYSLNDPRIKTIITVSEVKVSKDLSYAQVFVSFLNSDDKLKIKKLLIILNKSVSYIRKLLCKRMKLRIVPNIVFYHDDSSLKGNKISLILEDLIQNNENACIYE